MRKPDIYDSATYSLAYYLNGEGRQRAGDYVCYAPGAPPNAARWHAGRGPTERQAALAATYWANQAALVRVVPISRAPRWAIEEADTAAAENAS